MEAAQEVGESGGDPRTLRLYGQEVNLTTSAIARMNLFLHGLEDFVIVRGDSLRDPKFRTATGLERFNCVIANPPFSLKHWGADVWSTDPWNRAVFGVPPANTGDFAWVQHMVASMARNVGRVAVVMPHGVLFRGGAEANIRKGLVETDSLEAVIGLAENLFYSTPIPACILIVRAVKHASRRGQVLFVDGSNRFTKGRNQNTMSTEDVAAIIDAYERGGEVDGVLARLVPHQEIKGNSWDLNIGRYLKAATGEQLDVASTLAKFADAQHALREAEVRLAERLDVAGFT